MQADAGPSGPTIAASSSGARRRGDPEVVRISRASLTRLMTLRAVSAWVMLWVLGRVGLRAVGRIRVSWWSVAAAVGLSVATLRRHRSELGDVLELGESWSVRDWPLYSDGDQYYAFGPDVWSRILALGAHRCRGSVLRVLVYLIPMLRAARSAGRPYVVTTRDQACERLRMGSRSWSRALRLLQSAGLVTLSIGPLNPLTLRRPATRVLTTSVLAIDPLKVTRDTAQSDTAPKGHSSPVLEQHRASPTSSPPANLPAALTLGEQGAKQVLQEATGIEGPIAVEAAKRARTPEIARSWVRQLRPGLDSAESPAGWFVAALRAGSRPAQPSYLERVARQKQAEREAVDRACRLAQAAISNGPLKERSPPPPRRQPR